MNALEYPQRPPPPPAAYPFLKIQLARPLGAGGKSHPLQAAIFPALAPIAFAGFYGYRSAEREMTESVLAKRENISYLVATVLAEKLDRLIDVGVSLSTRVRLRELIEQRRWNEAIRIMGDVPSAHQPGLYWPALNEPAHKP